MQNTGHVTKTKKKSFTIITIKLLSPICKKQGMSQKFKKKLFTCE